MVVAPLLCGPFLGTQQPRPRASSSSSSKLYNSTCLFGMWISSRPQKPRRHPNRAAQSGLTSTRKCFDNISLIRTVAASDRQISPEGNLVWERMPCRNCEASGVRSIRTDTDKSCSCGGFKELPADAATQSGRQLFSFFSGVPCLDDHVWTRYRGLAFSGSQSRECQHVAGGLS